METKHKPRTLDKPFCWQEKSSLRLIRKMYTNVKRTRTALVIYLALTEMASNSGKNDRFMAYRSQIAELSATSPSTIDRYIDDFVQIGLLSKRNRRKKLINLSNCWYLNTSPSIHNTDDTSGKDTDERFSNDSDDLIEQSNKEQSYKNTSVASKNYD